MKVFFGKILEIFFVQFLESIFFCENSLKFGYADYFLFRKDQKISRNIFPTCDLFEGLNALGFLWISGLPGRLDTKTGLKMINVGFALLFAQL